MTDGFRHAADDLWYARGRTGRINVDKFEVVWCSLVDLGAYAVFILLSRFAIPCCWGGAVPGVWVAPV